MASRRRWDGGTWGGRLCLQTGSVGLGGQLNPCQPPEHSGARGSLCVLLRGVCSVQWGACRGAPRASHRGSPTSVWPRTGRTVSPGGVPPSPTSTQTPEPPGPGPHTSQCPPGQTVCVGPVPAGRGAAGAGRRSAAPLPPEPFGYLICPFLAAFHPRKVKARGLLGRGLQGDSPPPSSAASFPSRSPTMSRCCKAMKPLFGGEAGFAPLSAAGGGSGGRGGRPPPPSGADLHSLSHGSPPASLPPAHTPNSWDAPLSVDIISPHSSWGGSECLSRHPHALGSCPSSSPGSRGRTRVSPSPAVPVPAPRAQGAGSAGALRTFTDFPDFRPLFRLPQQVPLCRCHHPGGGRVSGPGKRNWGGQAGDGQAEGHGDRRALRAPRPASG